MTSKRSKFQSCPNELKLNIQSLLILLITKTPSLSILSQNCGSLCSNRTLIFCMVQWLCSVTAKTSTNLAQNWQTRCFCYQEDQEALDIQFQHIWTTLKFWPLRGHTPTFEAVALCPWWANLAENWYLTSGWYPTAMVSLSVWYSKKYFFWPTLIYVF